MATTSKRRLNKPDRLDNVNVVTALNNNFENLDDAVPDSRTVNGKPLSGNVTIGLTDLPDVEEAITAQNAQITNLKSALSDVEEIIPYYETEDNITNTLTWVDGKYIDVGSGNITTYSSLSYSVVGNVKTGDKYYFSGLRGIGVGRAITIISNSGIVNDHATVLEYEPENAGYFTGEYTIPVDGILVITTHSTTTSDVIAHKFNKHYKEIADEETVETNAVLLSELSDYTDYISPNKELIDYDNLTSGYINGQGGINAASGTSKEKTSQVIQINTGHTYKFECDVPSATGTSWLAVGFWDANDTWLGRSSAIVTTVGNISHAELTLLPKSNSSVINAAYMRVSWRTYGTQMATANDVTFEDKTIFEIIDERQSGADKTYKINGGVIDVSKSGFDVVQLGFAPLEESGKYTQGMAVSNGVIFQGYGNGTIDLIDLASGSLINGFNASGGHCGSLSFANVYPDGNTDFPYLYVASYNENKTFVYNVTRTECTLEKTYIIPESVAGYCQETCIDKVTGVLWCVGHKVNSYSAGDGLIVSAWDLSKTTNSNGMLLPTEIMHYDLPWVQYLQAVQVLNGQLFAVFGADGGTAGLLTHIMVSDLGMNIWKSDMSDFPSGILSAEPEGLDFIYNANTYKYDAILATRRSAHYYRLEF